MRTTLNIDDDVLTAVKEIARRDAKSAGAAASELLRKGLARPDQRPEPGAALEVAEPAAEIEGMPRGLEAPLGFRPFPNRGGMVTDALVDRLRDETGT